MSRPSLPSPPPLEGNDQLITAVITAGWAISLVILLIAEDQLAPADRWWVWVAVAGSAIGVFGLAYVPWLKRSRSRATAQRESRRQQPPAGVPGSRED